MNSSLQVLHITGSIGRESFGLGQVAVNMAKAENDLQIDAQIWCLDTAEQIDWAVTLPHLSRHKVRSFKRIRPQSLGFSCEMLSAVRNDGKQFQVIHQHGLWTACSHVSRTLRRVHQTPVVIAPHGTLQKWALQRSVWKKRLASLLYEKNNLQGAACLQATAEAEVSDFRDYGLTNPIAVIPNGISETWLSSTGNGSRFRQQFGINPHTRLLLFMSRITPKKGLPLLLEAVKRLDNQFADWRLVIAGNDEFNHLQEVKALIETLNLQNSVLFTGPLFDQIKRDAFAASEIFVLPSFSEGAPMVVLDSLAAGVPVITTQATPWQCLPARQCGWWVDISVDGLAQALQKVVHHSTTELQEMGQRGLELAKSEYLWRTQGQKALHLYQWLLGQQEKPEFVMDN